MTMSLPQEQQDQEIIRERHTMNIETPGKFDFSNPAEWPKWKKRFERYVSISGLQGKSQDEKINVLMYIMGDKSEEIMLQFPPPAPTTLENTLELFTSYFEPKVNVIFERFCFNTRNQKIAENADDFITSIHNLAAKCNFGNLKDELIRDRIVVGVLDVSLSEKLQAKSDLTLKEAILAVKQNERQLQQSKIIRGTGGDKLEFNEDNQSVNRIQKKNQYQPQGIKKCYFCGYDLHKRSECPARNVMCYNCSTKGHFAKLCQKPKKEVVRNIEVEEHGHDDIKNWGKVNIFYIEENHRDNKIGDKYKIDVFVSNLKRAINFLVDTGSDVVCIPYTFLSKEELSSLQQVRNVIIKGPDNKELEVMGYLSVSLNYKSRTCSAKAYVIKNLSSAILGRRAIDNLEILYINNISNDNQSTVNPKKEFPNLFRDIGQFKEEVSIRLEENSKPFAQSVPRMVPIPRLSALKEELNRLQELDIIEAIHEPTDWVAPIVVVPKDDGIRLCIDFTRLNQSVKRPYFPITKTDSKLALITKANYFSKIDLNKGFYQLKLNKDSQKLTTFITPFGRYFFKRLPFGISCAPEEFVSRFSRVVSGIKNIIFHVDEILIFADTVENHDVTLREVLRRLCKEGLTINSKKSEFFQTNITFLGSILNKDGISVDPSRIKAIKDFPKPANKKDLLRFLGMLNFVGRYINNRSEILRPLYDLLKDDSAFIWDVDQNRSFEKVKSLLIESPILGYYDPSKTTIVAADASNSGLGGCLYQLDEEGNKHIIGYSSRTLISYEKNYAVIEKEALAVTWACEKFEEFINGIPIQIETDHKPLIQILSTKDINALPIRLQKYRLRLQRYDYKVKYVKGEDQIIADCLSRAPIAYSKEDIHSSHSTEKFVKSIVRSKPLSDPYLEKIANLQLADDICSNLRKYSKEGWPEKSKLPKSMLPYFQHRHDISVGEHLLLKDSRIIIPSSMQSEVLELIHSGHQGQTKSRRRASSTVWWLDLNKVLEHFIESCPTCIEHSRNRHEPLIIEQFPSRPWSKLGADMFFSKKHRRDYLIITDYYSRYFEIFPMDSSTEDQVIIRFKQMISRNGKFDVIRTDGGPQFQTKFKNFIKEVGANHEPSSPYYSQSNGEAESAVKVAKNLIEKNDDILHALLDYRSTPLSNGYSPAELFLGRKLKTDLPILPSKLRPSNYKEITKFENKNKLKQALNYNRRHNVRPLKTLKINDPIFIIDLKKYGYIESKSKFPRSYIVNVNGKKYRRNRKFLNYVKPRESVKNNVENSLPTNVRQNNFELSYFENTLSPKRNVVNPKQKINQKLNSNNSHSSLITPNVDVSQNLDTFVSPCNNNSTENIDVNNYEHFASPYNSCSPTINNENNNIENFVSPSNNFNPRNERPKRNVRRPNRLLDYDIS